MKSAAPTTQVSRLKAVPTIDPRDRGGAAQPILTVQNLRKCFPIHGGPFNRKIAEVRAVDGVDLTVMKGETLGIVGESGCGKSTLARLLMHLADKDEGTVLFDGEEIDGMRGIALRDLRRNLQMVFQDSASSLNPRLPVGESVAYGPRVHGARRHDARVRAERLLERVGLDPRRFAARYPHELSGGQKQRVNIARALALEPRLVILDEAVSALDKSVEAQVLNLLQDLKRQFALTYLFISHDLNVVQYMSDRVVVMYLGEVVEVGPSDAVFTKAQHPYTRALVASRLSLDPDDRVEDPPLTGDPPSPVNPPPGCRFRTRCSFAEAICATTRPRLPSAASPQAHLAACHMCDSSSGHTRAPAKRTAAA